MQVLRHTIPQKHFFCYTLLYGNNSVEKYRAKKWAQQNIDVKTQQGYCKLSSILIPIMKRFPSSKKFFKIVALNSLEGMEKTNLTFWTMKLICKMLGNCNLNENDEVTLNSVFNYGKPA